MAVIHLFPHLPKQPGYNKRLRTLGAQITHLIAALATDIDGHRRTSRWPRTTRQPQDVSASARSAGHSV
jgi:hypothetical protein